MPHKKAKRSIREKTKSQQGTDLAPSQHNLTLKDEAIPKSAHRILNAASIREEFKKKRKATEEIEEGKKGAKKMKKEGLDLKNMKIQPGESMQHFNRRVEDDLRPLVKTAVQASRAAVRNAVKEEKEAKALAKKERESKAAAAKAKKNAANANNSDSNDNDSDDDPSSSSKTKTKDSTSKSKGRLRVHSTSPPPHSPIDKHASKPKEFATISSSAPKRLNDIALAPPEFKKLPRGATSTGSAGARSTSSAGSMGKGDGVLSMSMKLMMEKEREKAILRYRELKAARLQKEGNANGRVDDRD